MSNAFSALLKSRKFLTLLLSTVTSLILLVVGQYFPQYQEITTKVVEIIVPLALAVIAGITLEDSAAKLYTGRSMQ